MAGLCRWICWKRERISGLPSKSRIVIQWKETRDAAIDHVVILPRLARFAPCGAGRIYDFRVLR
jgi:hypothetical protein